MLQKIKKKAELWKKWLAQDLLFLSQHMRTSRCKKRIILFDTANHDNLGDHAIAMAEKQFAQRCLPDHGVIEIPGGNILRHTSIYRAFIRKTDVVTIAGGGFLGSLWEFEEQIVQCVLNNFSDNKIVIFPQTFYVEENDRTFMDSHKGYLAHKNLLICLRDEKSCNRLTALAPSMKDKIFYMPDMVCGLSVEADTVQRKGIAICFREDIECVVDAGERKRLEQYLQALGEPIEKISTLENRFIAHWEREEKVNAKLKCIASKKLVITDRLHAMLFAAITGTPCIAMNNKSGKVQGVYQWIKDQQHVCFVRSIAEVPQALAQLDLERCYHFDKSIVDRYWDDLAAFINGEKK